MTELPASDNRRYLKIGYEIEGLIVYSATGRKQKTLGMKQRRLFNYLWEHDGRDIRPWTLWMEV